MTRCQLASAAFAAILLSGVAAAHPLAPALLEMRELGAGEVEVRFKRPIPAVPGSRPELAPVAGCEALERSATAAEAGSVIEILRLGCGPAGLTGREIEVRGIAESRTDVVLRVERADGGVIRSLLTAQQPRFRIPERESAAEVLWAYGRLGAVHILGGFDHLLFVLGLVVLAGSLRGLVLTVTAFTVGHSVTLALASLDLVRLSPRPVELAIAASILYLAVELARSRPGGRRVPVPLAFGFGLLHGLGFAGALREVGLPASALPLALFSFNAGIELGQLAFVMALLALGLALGRGTASLLRPPRSLRLASAYGIGIAASFWMFERLAGLGAAW